MPKEKPSNGGTYWQGQTDQKLEALSSAVNEIKMTVAKVDEKLDALRLWKAKVYGGAAVVSAVVAAAVKYIGGH